MGPYQFHVYSGHIESRVATYLRITWRPPGIPWGLLAPLLLFIPVGYAQVLNLFLEDLRYPIPIQAYNKSRYQAVYSDSEPDTPWLLSQARTGPTLNMVCQTPLVFK